MALTMNRLFQNIFSPRAVLVQSHHFFNLISKIFKDYLLQLNMAKRRHFFNTLGPETKDKNILTKSELPFDLKLLKGD